MSSIAWWPILTLLAMATVVDIHSRRIPNWLVPPFLAAGVMPITAGYGVRGWGRSMGGIVGGVPAPIWAACHGWLRESREGASDLVSAFWTKGVRPHPSLVLDHPSARTVPCAPAIAIGTIFSFFAV